MRKFILQIMAVLMIAVMLVPFAGNAATAYAEETHKGSVTFTASGEWVEKEVSINELIGNVSPAAVKAIKFTGDAAFAAGYNTVDHVWEWSSSSRYYSASNIALDGWYAFKFALTANDGKEHTIKWEVVTDEEAAAEDNIDAAAAYTGDYTMGYKFAASEFAKFDGDVRLTFRFARTGQHDNYSFTLIKNVEGWPKLTRGEYAEIDYEINAWDFIDLFDPSVSEISVVLSERVVKELAAGTDLGIQVYGIVITKAELKAIPKATPTPTPSPTPTPTPEPKLEDVRKEYGGTLTITDKMASKGGSVVIQNAEYDAIVVERSEAIKTVYLKNVGTKSLEIEGGATYSVWTRDCDLGDLSVTAPKLAGLSMSTLRKMMDEKQPVTMDQVAEYAVYKKELDQIKDKTVSVILDGYCTVEDVEIAASAKVDFTRIIEEQKSDEELELFADTTEAPNLVVSCETDNLRKMNVLVNGFKGNIQAKLPADKLSYTYLFLAIHKSEVGIFSCEGTDGTFYINGDDTTVDAVVADNVKVLTVGLAAENVIVSDNTANADISIYDKVENVTIAGEGNDLVLADAARVNNAAVTGDNVRVYGFGHLGNTEITGTGANVAVRGAAVTGENNTSVPREMAAMAPDANSSSGSSSSMAAPEEEENKGPVYTFKYDANNTQPKYSFLITDYLPDYQEGEEVKITIKTSSTSWYGGGMGGNDLYYEGEYGNWKQADFSNDTPQVTLNITEKYNGYGSIDVQIFWWGDPAQVATQEIVIESITVTRVNAGGDSGNETPSVVEVDLDSSYPGGWAKGAGIPADSFSAFDDDVKVTLAYKVIDGAADPQFKPITSSWGGVATSKSGEGVCLKVTGSEGIISFVLDKSVINQAIYFQVNEMYLTSATICLATPDDYYVGNNEEAATLSKSELAGYGSDVKVTFTFRTVTAGYSYYQIFLQEKGDDWSYLGADTFDVVEDYSLNTYNCIELNSQATTLTVILSSAGINALPGDIKVGVWGVIIEDVAIEAVN